MTAHVTMQALTDLMLAQTAPAGDTLWRFPGELGPGLALGLAALGSCLGVTAAGQAAAGAWAKEGKAGKPLSFTYVIFIGAPLSQTLYAMIVMLQMRHALYVPELSVPYTGLLLTIGIATGIGEMMSAWGQGLIGAAGIRCLSENEGKGFAFLVMAIGIIETVGIFVMLFMMLMIPSADAVKAAAAAGGGQ